MPVQTLSSDLAMSTLYLIQYSSPLKWILSCLIMPICFLLRNNQNYLYQLFAASLLRITSQLGIVGKQEQLPVMLRYITNSTVECKSQSWRDYEVYLLNVKRDA